MHMLLMLAALTAHEFDGTIYRNFPEAQSQFESESSCQRLNDQGVKAYMSGGVCRIGQPRLLDQENPYIPSVRVDYIPIDEREYQKSRRYIAEACQDLTWELNHLTESQKQDPRLVEVMPLMHACSADSFEDAILMQWREEGEDLADCPIVELMTMSGSVIRLFAITLRNERFSAP